jgi:hypothetical protein
MSRNYGLESFSAYLRDEEAGVSLEYIFIVVSMMLFVGPTLSHYVSGVKRLFGFVGLLIR